MTKCNKVRREWIHMGTSTTRSAGARSFEELSDEELISELPPDDPAEAIRAMIDRRRQRGDEHP